MRSWGGAGIDLTVGGSTFTGRLSELRLRVVKISNCSLERNGGNGIVASERSAITNNIVFGSAVVGIKVSSNCVVSGNFCVQANGASGVGISATGNHVVINTVGLLIGSAKTNPCAPPPIAAPPARPPARTHRRTFRTYSTNQSPS